jgi:hypothetical protein
MRSAIVWQRLWQWIDVAMDAIIWGWDMLMMYVAALVLIPMSVLGTLKLLGIVSTWNALVQIGADEVLKWLMLLGAPLWLAVTLYARFGRTRRAAILRHRLEQWKWAVVWVSCGAMGTFGVVLVIFGS